ncbi:fimbrial protein [Serratia sp. NA_112.1]|uniref:fimbrial protein n=1 Tax=Serratia sp. NA_112.1 TaxID=3415665 RepID=UPI004046D8F8
MRIRECLPVLLALLASSQVSAECVLDTSSESAGVPPTTLFIPGFTLFIDADAPADTAILLKDSGRDSSRGGKVRFVNCEIGEAYGKNVTPLLLPTPTRSLFNTKVEGIAIKPRWNNGEAFGQFPSRSSMTANAFDYPAASFFRIEFYKTQKRLRLSNPNGDVLLEPGQIAYNWVSSDNRKNVGQSLNIGEIRVISTPVCRLDGEKTVNFNTVSTTNINNGIKRPLNFSLTCVTDYGSYSTSAALSTQTPTADKSFIQVTDNGNNLDRLKIRVDDSNGQPLPVDGSRTEIKRAINSDTAAQFNWSATLLRASGTLLPENGPFTASAEIVLQVN